MSPPWHQYMYACFCVRSRFTREEKSGRSAFVIIKLRERRGIPCWLQSLSEAALCRERDTHHEDGLGSGDLVGDVTVLAFGHLATGQCKTADMVHGGVGVDDELSSDAFISEGSSQEWQMRT